MCVFIFDLHSVPISHRLLPQSLLHSSVLVCFLVSTLVGVSVSCIASPTQLPVAESFPLYASRRFDPCLGNQCVSHPGAHKNKGTQHYIAVAPSLIKNHLAVGVPTSDQFPLITYNALSFENQSDFTQAPSPRYWLLCTFPPNCRPRTIH